MSKKLVIAVSSLLFACACDNQRSWDKDIWYLDVTHQMCRNLKDAKLDKPLSECNGYLAESVETFKSIDSYISHLEEELKGCQKK